MTGVDVIPYLRIICGLMFALWFLLVAIFMFHEEARKPRGGEWVAFVFLALATAPIGLCLAVFLGLLFS